MPVSIAHLDWSLVIRICTHDPGHAKSLAKRFNAIAQFHAKNLIENKSNTALESVDKITELVHSSVAAGAAIKAGGKSPAGVGAFYPATVLSVKKQ